MIAMEFLANPVSSAQSARNNRTNSNSNFEAQTTRSQTLCKRRCCGCTSRTNLKCMGICMTGAMLLVVGAVLIAMHFAVNDDKTFLIPALVLFILGIIFISIAEWVCRVKLYHRYGRNHQRTLERLTGIERRLNRPTTARSTVTDVPPPYGLNQVSRTRELPTDNRFSATTSVGNLRVPRTTVVERECEAAPSYSATVSDDVLPTYQEATSANFGSDFIVKENKAKN